MDNGIRLIQTGNVGLGSFREQGYRYISEQSFRELACTEIFPGDVLICRLDGPVGRACLVPSLRVRMITSVDKAHGSQSGEAAAEMKGVLAGRAIAEQAKEAAEQKTLPDYEEEILKAVTKGGQQPNLSFYAFTATPKYKTLETIGRKDESGKPEPFHIYSMRQAIEEGFIFDVLKYYTTYKTYFKLVKSVTDDPKLDKKKAARALARFVSFHPHNLASKSEVVIEHFRASTRHKIGGRAKAMVVTGSRAHAVRYKQEFDNYLAEKGYTDIKTLVAFSIGDESTEVGMNLGIKEKELPKRFSSDEFQVLIVAEKYQTGFDQPLRIRCTWTSASPTCRPFRRSPGSIVQSPGRKIRSSWTLSTRRTRFRRHSGLTMRCRWLDRCSAALLFIRCRPRHAMNNSDRDHSLSRFNM